MFDWSQIRDLAWEARWDAIVLVAQAIWLNLLAHWWFGPMILVILMTSSRKAWLRLIRFVGVGFVRGNPLS